MFFKRSIFAIFFTGLLLAGCSGGKSLTETQAPERWMTVAYTEGLVQIQTQPNGGFEPLHAGDPIPVTSSLSTGADALLHVEINDGSAFIAGADSLITFSQFSPGLENTQTTLDLAQGSVLVVAANSSMGASGAFEVKTAMLTLTLKSPEGTAFSGRKLAMPVQMPSGYVGSGYVTIEKGKTPAEAVTKTGMLSGNGTVTLPGGSSLTLQLEQYVEVDFNTDEIQVIPLDLQDEARLLNTYNLAKLIYMLTGTPAPSPTASKTPLPGTATATQTPFPTFAEPTASNTPMLLPTHRASTPNADWTPGPDGLTPEESANNGTHSYSGSGVAYGRCTYSGSEAENIGSITFTLDEVTLSGEDASDSISYPKVSPNVYQLTLPEQGKVATITFFIDGWDMEVTLDGKACSYQTFLIK